MATSTPPSGLIWFLRRIFFVEILKGLTLTLKHLVSRPVTRQYPAEQRELVPGARGLHALVRDAETGCEKCVGCGLCAAMCPSVCIRIITGEDEQHEKVVHAYEINTLKCLFCGLCIEACPYGALVMTGHFAYSGYSREDFLFSKEELLSNWDRLVGEEKSKTFLDRFWKPKARDFSGESASSEHAVEEP